MRALSLVMGYAVVAFAAGTAGWLVGAGRDGGKIAARPISSIQAVRAAQAQSFYGAHPKWLDPKDAGLQVMRDRGYRFCLDAKKADDRACEAGQDQAIQFVRLLPLLLKDSGQIDAAHRTPVQQRLAEMPDMPGRAQDYCWRLYPARDTADARILAACLSNLTDGGIVVPPPVS